MTKSWFIQVNMRIFYATARDDKDKPTDILSTQVIPNYLAKTNSVFCYIYSARAPSGKFSFEVLANEITKADVFIGEMSTASQTLGFQLAYALKMSKPCLYLYHVSKKGKPDTLIFDNPSRNLKVKIYDLNYEKILKDFLKYSDKQLITSRTSFMSTKEIDEFLNLESKKQQVTKGELIRQILHDSIK